MKRVFSLAISSAMILTSALNSPGLAAQPTHVAFTTDTPCAVDVLVLSYTNPANVPGQSANGVTPWQLDVYPATSVTFFYPSSVVCNGSTYNYVSASPRSPLTSGAEGDTTTVTGHYIVLDTTPPVWSVPTDFSVEATSSVGAVVTYTASASDPDDEVSSQACVPASGATFPLGTTTVNCTATDTHNNTGTASFNVTVVDTTPPSLFVAVFETEATGPAGAVGGFSAFAVDIVDGPIDPICAPVLGSIFPLGTTPVTCSATDTHSNTSSTSFNVTVVDTTPPALSLPSNITVNAVNASGATVDFTASASDLVDGPVDVTCSPSSGSTFPIGTTTVDCSATDSHNNTANGSFTVTVVDNEAPILTLPSDITVNALNASGAVVNFTVSANDLIDGSVPVTCLPVSGSTFSVGTTTVNCSATDSHNNTSTGSFNITVLLDTTPPVLTLPDNITVNALNASGAPVSFTASAHDVVDGPVAVTCSPVSGSTFPIATTTVNCSASDSRGNNASGSFAVTVVDNNAPVLTLPADISVTTSNASGETVNFVASANDLVDGPVAVTCLPASGSLFPLGTTTVNCSATDSHENTANGSFNVTVLLIVDTTPPALTLPADMVVEASSAAGAVVNFTASANDIVDGPVAVICLPASGSLFPLGTTTINCSAADSQGNISYGSFTVTVVDTAPPVLTLPANITVTALNASGAPVSFIASANDAVDGSVAVTCSPVSGSTFPIGTTTVNCSATDSRGNNASGSFNISVQYAPAGTNCRGVAGHQILQPIDVDGSSVFNAGRTVPAKFRVCGADGNAIGTDGVVSRFRLIQIISGDTVSNVDEAVASTTSDTEFRSGNQQWIFNIDTKDLLAGNTYVYLITLNDGSTIQFQFTLR